MDRGRIIERATHNELLALNAMDYMLNFTKRNLNGKEFDPSRAFPKAEEHF